MHNNQLCKGTMTYIYTKMWGCIVQFCDRSVIEQFQMSMSTYLNGDFGSDTNFAICNMKDTWKFPSQTQTNDWTSFEDRKLYYLIHLCKCWQKIFTALKIQSGAREAKDMSAAGVVMWEASMEEIIHIHFSNHLLFIVHTIHVKNRD